MFNGSKGFLLATFAAVILGLAGCASQKEPAEQALAAIQKKFEESGAEIQKYLPERHAEISRGIEELRDAASKEDYGDVVTGTRDVEGSLKKAIADARIRRAQVLVEMETEWGELVKTMPPMVAAMDKKISSQRGRPPQGMTSDTWKATVKSYDEARDAWTKAASEITSKNFEATVLAARDAKTKIAALMETLGVKAS
jgi:hypothetical protein